MRKMIAFTFTLLLTTAFALAQTQPEKKAEKPKKAAAAAKAPKSDADVQKCINDKLATNKAITGGTAAVASLEATLTGEAKNAGAKNSAGKTATGCGAKKVTNNITVAAAPAKGAAKPAAKKP